MFYLLEFQVLSNLDIINFVIKDENKKRKRKLIFNFFNHIILVQLGMLKVKANYFLNVKGKDFKVSFIFWLNIKSQNI